MAYGSLGVSRLSVHDSVYRRILSHYFYLRLCDSKKLSYIRAYSRRIALLKVILNVLCYRLSRTQFEQLTGIPVNQKWAISR